MTKPMPPTRAQDPVLELMLFPMRCWMSGMKSAWRTHRNQHLIENGLPSLDEKEEQGIR